MESKLGYKSLNRLSFVTLSLNWLLFPHSSCPALIPSLCHLPSPPLEERLLETRSQSVLRTMLWRGAGSLLPLPGLGQNTPGKVKAPFSSCLCGRSWVSPLSWDTPHMCTSSYWIVCQQLWDKIDLYICLTLPAFSLRETTRVWQDYAHAPKIPNGASAAMGSCRRGLEHCRSCSACSAPPNPCLVHPQKPC